MRKVLFYLKKFIFILSVVLSQLTLSFADGIPNISHMVGVYVSPRGQQLLANEVDKIFELNGIDVYSYYIHEKKIKLDKKHINELLPDNEKLKDLAQKVRYYFNRFFRGVRIRPHHEFEIDLNGIEASGDWDKMGVTIVGPGHQDYEENSNRIKVILNTEVRNLRFGLDKLRARDLQHSFIGDVGPDNFYLQMAGDSVPLKFSLPMEFELNRKGGFNVEVLQPELNIADIKLESGWSALKLPRVAIRITGHGQRRGRTAYLRLKEVERLLVRQKDKLSTGLKETVQKWTDENLVSFVDEKVNGFLNKGFTEVNDMAALGAPEGARVAPYRWGVKLQQVDFLDNHLHVGLKGFVTDPSARRQLAPERGQMAIRAPYPHAFRRVPYDVALTLNQGFINRILQLSTVRGYFDEMEAGGEKLKITKQPEFEVKGSAWPKLKLEIEYRVDGIQGWFVRNPMRIQFDLRLRFRITKSGKVQMVVRDIDLDSVRVHKRYIRAFKKKVRNAVKDKFREINDKLDNFILADELPIPTNLGGLPIRPTRVLHDVSGHLLIFLDYQLDNLL